MGKLFTLYYFNIQQLSDGYIYTEVNSILKQSDDCV